LIGYVGDSPVALGREEKNDLTAIGGFCRVHNGENPTEEQRIKEYGATINSGVYITPPLQSGFSFAQLAVSRALGHRYFSKYGVIPDPEFPDYRINKSDRYLIVTSDGVSDVLSPDVMCSNIKTCAKSMNLNEVAKTLVELSIETWDAVNSDPISKSDMPDNTTALIVDLKKLGSKKK